MLLDVGCGPANYSAMFCERYPELKCTGLDLPHALEVAAEHVKEMNMTRQIELVATDYRKAASLGHNYDVVFLSHILHQEDMQVCVDLLGKCYTALEPGGLVVVQAMFPDDGGMRSSYAALHDLLTLLIFPGGKNHTIDDVSGWLSEVGFVDVHHNRLSLVNTNSLVICCKPGS
jgi:cyclopropane fatty-acyl-phospholipid synthase-like methyltransferase